MLQLTTKNVFEIFEEEIAHLSLPRLRTCVSVTMRPFGSFTCPHLALGATHEWDPWINFPKPIDKFGHYLCKQCSLDIEVDCRKQQTYSLRLYFVHFAIANLFMILMVSISHRRSCSVFFRIRLFSMFWLMVLIGSFYNLKFRKWPFFFTAVVYYERQICTQIISQVGKRILQAHYPKTS